MEREIILDTETTGLRVSDGERIIEIGCIELYNRLPTGNFFHHFIKPADRLISEGAMRVHGITNQMVADKPLFEEIADEFINFIGDSKLIIHNADFDIPFLNAELFYAKKPDIKMDRVFCTLKFARKKFPGAQCSLDALCKRFNIDNSHREKHGALLDSELLAEVYLELMGGRQNSIELAEENKTKNSEKTNSDNINNVSNIISREFKGKKLELSEDEIKNHKEFAEKFTNSMWSKIYNS